MTDNVTILGVRGSVPVSGRKYQRYGGATTCVLVEMDGIAILLDAGTGILHLPDRILQKPDLHLLLTHPHMDHLMGLPMCPYMFQKNVHLSIWSSVRDGLDTRAQVERLVSSPLWPVNLSEMPAEVSFHDLPEKMQIGHIQIETISGVHPGGVSILKLIGNRHCIVFITDCTLTDELRPALIRFAKDCDLLFIDGQYF